ncbi:hypothetical protein OUHCRE13_46970 [Enterobacter roggenkampii]
MVLANSLAHRTTWLRYYFDHSSRETTTVVYPKDGYRGMYIDKSEAKRS